MINKVTEQTISEDIRGTLFFGRRLVVKYYKRYEKLKEMLVKITDMSPEYDHMKYEGVFLDSSYKPLDIALVCANGKLPFGAHVYITDNRFVCNVYK